MYKKPRKIIYASIKEHINKANKEKIVESWIIILTYERKCDIINKKYPSIMVLDGYFKRENRHKLYYIYKLNGEMSRSPNFLQSL